MNLSLCSVVLAVKVFVTAEILCLFVCLEIHFIYRGSNESVFLAKIGKNRVTQGVGNFTERT